MKCYVYEIRIGSKVYIGGTTQDPQKRFDQHLEDLRNKSHSNFEMQNLFNLGGTPKPKVLWSSGDSDHYELARMENMFMQRRERGHLMNYKQAKPSDYSKKPFKRGGNALSVIIFLLFIAYIYIGELFHGKT